jgi:hypothetical protein
MKILFVLRAAGYFPYHRTTIDHLIARGHEVTLAFETRPGRPDDRGFDEWIAEHKDRVAVRDAVQRGGLWRHLLFPAREARSYASYCRRGPEVTFYRERWRRYMPGWLDRLAERSRIAQAIFGLELTEAILGAVERASLPSLRIVRALRRDRPDCVVVSPMNMLLDEEVEYVKAARARGIPSVMAVMSWDNLTTKGLVHVPPDYLLAWHHGHAHEAQVIHGVPADRIVVTGSPFFDKWFDAARPIGSRAATCRLIDADSVRPYLLYLGSSANIARDESWLVLALVHGLRKSPERGLRDLQVVFKPHPGGSQRNIRALPRLDEAGVLVWARERGRPDTAEAVDQFRDVLHHAAVVVGVNTTGMLDAVLCDRPCLALTVERYRRTQSDTAHFRRIQESKALLRAGSIRRTIALIKEILDGKDRTAAARRDFSATYARPRGVGAAAGEAAAMAIELAAQRLSADAITAAIDTELRGRPLPAIPTVEVEPDPAAASLR